VIPAGSEVEMSTGMADPALDSVPGDRRAQSAAGREANSGSWLVDEKTDDGDPSHRSSIAPPQYFTKAYR
jgi:hypothetical protein